MLLYAKKTYNLHLQKACIVAYVIGLLSYTSVLRSTFCTHLPCLWLLLQRKKVSPKGLTFVSFAVADLALTTSLAVRSVALWVKAHWLALCYSHLHGTFASAVYFVTYVVIWPVGLSYVITFASMY